MLEATIVADDLTGAADAGAQFARAGVPTFVAIADGADAGPARVIAVDADTRRLPDASAAGACAEELARRAYRRGTSVLYKKIDSTLRGHVGAEVAGVFRAALAAMPGMAPIVVASPAFPRTGRTMVRGRVRVAGVAPEGAQAWRCSGPRGEDDLVTMLREADLATAAAGLDVVRSDADALTAALGDLRHDAIVCDAEREDDLAAIASAGSRQRRPVVWVGSAGLASHLPRALRMRGEQIGAPRNVAKGPVLILVGSRAKIARDQARAVERDADVAALAIQPDALLVGEGDPRWCAASAALDRALAAGRDVVLQVGATPDVASPRATALAAALARLAAMYADRLGGVVATGGDTARGVLAALGAGGLRLLGEVESGVAIGVAEVPRPVLVVTKAGGFGAVETLQRARAVVKHAIEGT